VVTVYAGAGVCADAKSTLERRGDEAEGVRVRIECLSPTKEGGGGLDLAAVGADARRAVEDSTSVAVLVERGRANDFARPILDEAELALIATSSGAKAMTEVLKALDSRDSDEAPRASVWEAR